MNNQEWIDRFIEHCDIHRRMKENSLVRYRLYLRRFFQEVGKAPEDVITTDINQHIARLKSQDLATNSLRQHQVAIRMFFSWWAKQDRSRQNPGEDVIPIREEIKVPNVPSPTDILKLLYSIDMSDYIGRRNAAIIALLAATGIRAGECERLKVGNIQLKEDNFLLNVPRVKSYERQVPFGLLKENDVISEFFSQYYLDVVVMQQWSSNMPLFITAGIRFSGDKFKSNGIWRMMKKQVERADLPEWITVHSLRHYFATYFIANGGDIMQLKDLMGHALVSTTQRYIHLASLVTPEDIIRRNPLTGITAPGHMRGYVKLLREYKKSIDRK